MISRVKVNIKQLMLKVVRGFIYVKNKITDMLRGLYLLICSFFRFVGNYPSLIVFLIGLTLINVGVYMFIPFLCYITTGATLVGLSFVIDRLIDENIKLKGREGEDE